MEQITAIESVKPGAARGMMAVLQDQMARFADMANSLNAKARADYVALQAALASGNVAIAEAALLRLEDDYNPAPTATAATASSTSAASATAPAASAGQAAATAPSAPPPPGQQLNAIA